MTKPKETPPEWAEEFVKVLNKHCDNINKSCDNIEKDLQESKSNMKEFEDALDRQMFFWYAMIFICCSSWLYAIISTI